MPTSAREPAERTHARDRPVALARLGIASDDAARGDVRARPRARRSAESGSCARSGSASTSSWQAASPVSTGSSGASSARCRCGAEVALVDAERLGDERAAGAAGWRRAGRSLPRTRAMRTGSRSVRDEPCGESRRRGRASRRSRPACPPAASCASHGRSDCASAPRHRARPSARAATTLAAVGPDRIARRDEVVALAHLGCARAVPRPSGEQPRTSTACAATTRPSASSSSPTRDLLAQPAGGQRRHRDAVLDALGEQRRGRLGRDAGAPASAPRP